MNFALGLLFGLVVSGTAYAFEDRIRLLLSSKLKRVEAKLNPPKS